MKRFISLVFRFLMLLVLLSSCSKTNNQTKGNSKDKISIITTIFAPYDFVREIGGDKVNVTMLLPPASESHSFEPTPKDIIKIQNCNLFIYIGGESDKWVDKIVSSIDNNKVKIVTLMDCVDVVEEELVEGMQEEVEEESGEIAYDEHVWTSPKNAKLIVKKIADTLCEIDEKNASYYKKNSDDYIAKLDELDASFQKVVDEGVRKTIIFGDRFPFRYFANTYGLSYFAAFPGCSTETEPSATTITFLIDKIKEEKIPVVFHIELSNKKMADTISEETGAKVLLFHACHNISKDDFKKGKSYLDLMRQNVENLREALL